MANVVKQLRNKIWIILSASFYVLIFTILTILYLMSEQRSYEDIYQRLYSSLLSQEMYFSNVFFTMEINPQYEVVRIYSEFNLADEHYDMLANLILENARDHNIITVGDETWAYAFVPIGEIFPYVGFGYQRIVMVDVSEIMTQHHNFFRILIIIGFGSLLIVTAGSYFVAKYFVKSTRKSFETQELITAQQKKFTANATHELKTPIAMIKGSYDEILRNKDQTIESQLKWFDMIEFGTKRMENLTNELLLLARLEGEKIELQVAEVDVTSVINRTIEVMQVLANEKGIRIAAEIEDGIVLQLNEEKFVQVGMIFLENAIKYVNDNGRIEVRVNQKDGKTMISIQNTGPGISPEALPRLFDRFYRADQKGKSGSGLGLPIAKEILEQLGGEITIDSIVDEVTTVLLKF